jgi:hypothetical protein
VKPDDEAKVVAAIRDARRAGVPEREIDRVVRRSLARGETPFTVFVIEGALRNMAREASEARRAGA